MRNKFIHRYIFILLACFHSPAKAELKQHIRPNILLIVADDLGYTDLGCYGGDIKTPNIDLIARRGVQFTRFHTSPLCAPTRSMILSGNDNHVAGMGSMFTVAGTTREGKPGYEHQLTDRIVTVAQLLKDGGYQTFMAGKWHLGMADSCLPFAKGFEKSFVLLNGAATHFNNNQIFFDEPSQYRLDNQSTRFPEGSFSTDVYTDKIMSFIKGRKKDQPFFAYLAYTAPHWPLQVPVNEIDNYKGHYDIGYDSLRVIRFSKLKEMGLTTPGESLPPRTSWIKPWSTLSAEEKKLESRKMELYAVMVENLDRHIGQLIQFLKDTRQFDNTIIVFMSDNGAAAEDFYNLPASFGPFLREHYDNSFENMGKPSSFVSYGPQWAQAGAAPFKLFKEYAAEGGVVTPLIIAGKNVTRKPGVQPAFINVMDLAPTFLELAGIKYPVVYKNKKMVPMLGESCLSYLNGKTNVIHSKNYVYGMEHNGQCFIIKGSWKITNVQKPFDENAFALYNLDKDPGETNDVSKLNPKKYKELLHEWELFKKKTGVIPKEKGE